MTSRNKLIGAAALLASLLLTTGCGTASLVTGAPAQNQTFDLALAPTQGGTRPTGKTSLQLIVYEPSTLRWLEGDRVVVRLANAEISQLAGATWSDRLPVLVQARMIDALATSGLFRAVSNGREKVNGDLSISSTLQAFQIEHLGTGDSAKVAIRAKLVDERTGSVLDSRTFSADAKVPTNAPSDHVAAINSAFASIAADIVKWVAEKDFGARRQSRRSSSNRTQPLPAKL